MSRRVLSLWFPRLAAERVMRKSPLQDPSSPFAIVTMQKNAWRLCSMNAAAERSGLRRGVALTDARALCPGLTTAQAEPEREAGFLNPLAAWAHRVSPLPPTDAAD